MRFCVKAFVRLSSACVEGSIGKGLVQERFVCKIVCVKEMVCEKMCNLQVKTTWSLSAYKTSCAVSGTGDEEWTLRWAKVL